jgi:hypothetical protein
MFPAMPILQVVLDSLRDGKVRLLTAGVLRRTAMVAGAVGLTAGAGLLFAGSALASNGSQPGNLILHPASGATTLQPTWSTTTACPVGYQGSAEVSAFQPNGAFGSRISLVVSTGLTHRFSGMLDYEMALLLKLGARVGKGQGSEWAVGCYSGIAGTGHVKWVQCTFVTLSSTGSSYSTSTHNGSASSTTGQQASTSGNAQSAAATTTGGNSTQVEAASIAGACGLAVAIAGIAWQRRRNRSRLQ